MVYKSFEELFSKLSSNVPPKRLAVAAADDEHTLRAVFQARSEGVVAPLLIGNKDRIKRILADLDEKISDDAVFHEENADQAAERATRLVREDKADFLMKGHMQTADMIRAVLNKEYGLMDGGMVSLFAIAEIPKYHKLLAMADSGIVNHPTLDQKKHIIINSVNTLKAFGYDNPKVAVLAAVENVNPKMQETVDAAALADMNRKNEISDCIVEGPLSIDIALSSEVAKTKGVESMVAGDPDLLIWPDVVSGNIAAKALEQLADMKTIVIAVGAKAPLVITSRGATVESKYMSIKAAALMTMWDVFSLNLQGGR